MSNFADIIAKQKNSIILLYRAVSKDGQDFYAYIRCNEKQYHKVKQDFIDKKSCVDAAEYGEVIYVEFGKEPDEKAKKILSDYIKIM